MKYGNPFGKNAEVWITQTYHTGYSNTAIDCYGKQYKANLPVYAIADGVIDVTSSSYGSYCRVNVDNSDHFNYYVHTWKWKKKGTRVKKGEVICYIAPKSVNGGYGEHLHLALQAGLYIMDYIDRGITFRTKYSDIKKEWFKGDNLDWGLFKDLSYNNEAMLNINDRVEITADTNMRFGNGTGYKVAYLIKKGAVGRIVGGPRTADGYTWYDIYFEDCPKVCKYASGWMANVGGNRFKKTSKAQTCVDGSKKPVEPPKPIDPCEEYKKEISRLKTDLSEVIAENDRLEDKIEELDKELFNALEQLQFTVTAEEEETEVLLAIVEKRVEDAKFKL